MIEVNGVKGFIRFYPGLSFGNPPIYMSYEFPFENYNVAIDYNL
jgi:hypothetical protein